MRAYITIALCALAILGLTACSWATSDKTNTPSTTKGISQENESRLCSVSISQSHMNRYECYSFELYEDKGKVYFNCSCMNPDKDTVHEYREEQITVPAEELHNAQTILDKYNSKEFLKNYRKPIKLLHACDETTTTFSARWSDTNYLTANTGGPAGKELVPFFRKLATKYGKELKE